MQGKGFEEMAGQEKDKGMDKGAANAKASKPRAQKGTSKVIKDLFVKK